MPAEPQIPIKRVNISITGEDAELIEQLQSVLNKKLMLNLSMVQVIKRLVRQAAAVELNS